MWAITLIKNNFCEAVALRSNLKEAINRAIEFLPEDAKLKATLELQRNSCYFDTKYSISIREVQE